MKDKLALSEAAWQILVRWRQESLLPLDRFRGSRDLGAAWPSTSWQPWQLLNVSAALTIGSR